MGGLLVAFLDGTYSAPVFRSTEAAGASAKGPGCRYYTEAGGCCRPCLHAFMQHRAEGAVAAAVRHAGASAHHCLGYLVPSPRLHTGSLLHPLLPSSAADVDRLKLGLAKAEGDVDVLLTCEWPAGLCDGLPDAAKPPGLSLDGEGQGPHRCCAARAVGLGGRWLGHMADNLDVGSRPAGCPASAE